MPPEYVTREEFDMLRDDVREIKDNHLQHIHTELKEGNLRLGELELQVAEARACFKTAKWIIGIAFFAGTSIAGLLAAFV